MRQLSPTIFLRQTTIVGCLMCYVLLFFVVSQAFAQSDSLSHNAKRDSAWLAETDSVLLAHIQLLVQSDSLLQLAVGDSLLLVKQADTIRLFRLSPQWQWVSPSRPDSLAGNPTAATETSEEVPAKQWKMIGTLNLNAANVGLVNWAAGGESSIAFGAIGNLVVQRETDAYLWDSNIRAAYGVVRLNGRQYEKSDDAIRITTVYSQKFSPHWSLSARANFETQFDVGYRFDRNTRERLSIISDFLSPGRLEIGSGLRYSTGKNPNFIFDGTFSPVTGKLTYVLSDTVNETDYGLLPGTKRLSELGMQLNTQTQISIMENVSFQNSLRLFANYDRPENVDVNWETLLVLKVNRFLNANFATNLIYDDDTDIVTRNSEGEITSSGPRVQFKHVLNVGVNFIFQ